MQSTSKGESEVANSDREMVQDSENTSIRQFLEDDHRRLERLLDRAGACGTSEELAAFDQFRRGILKHIGMEEKILLPAAQKARGGKPLEVAARLRRDHGAFAALMMPLPRPAIIRAIRAVLAVHNPIEEGPEGVYEQCEALAGVERAEILARLRTAPEVPTKPHLDSIRVIEACRSTLKNAGYDPSLLDE